jgi:hypothetical protein
LDDNKLTEFELFVDKDFPEHESELEIIYNAIEEMQYRGAKSIYFKDESNANAMPVVTKAIMDSNKGDYGIRLYCIRLTDQLVVLLNGEIKTESKAQDCINVKKHFKNAVTIATKLDTLVINREINFQETDCLINLEFEI